VNKRRYGVAFDIGTSKIEAALVDLDSGQPRVLYALPNKQLLFGADVMTRLNFALKGYAQLKKLNQRLFETIDAILGVLLEKTGIAESEIAAILCVGNSAMHHLALSIQPDRLAKAPFQPSSSKAEFSIPAAQAGCTVCPEADFTFLPNLGGFVGSDALAVIIASGMYTSEAQTLVIDIGTNGEIALGRKGRIVVASTSAGPAFEGWKTSCGMPAVDGAIESIRVEKDRQLNFTTIGENDPAGLCGSALIDLLKYLLDMKLLDKTGKIENEKFRICDSLYLTQEDIRELQLAKAAIQAAVAVLRSRFDEKIARVFLTGRFGSHLSRDNARAIGIIPRDIDRDKVYCLQHGALEGAKTLLCSEEARRAARKLYTDITHVNLSEEKRFQDEFVNAIHF